MNKLMVVLLGYLLLFTGTGWASEKPPTVAFYYGEKPPFKELRAFDVVVVAPENVQKPAAHTRTKEGAHLLFAHVSLGEVLPSNPDYAKFPAACFANVVGDNGAVKQTCPEWSAFFLDTVIEPLWKKGWRAFFFDDVDAYQLFAHTEAERATQLQAMSMVLHELKRRHPEVKFILNQGFDLIPLVANLTYAVATDSLFEGYNPKKQSYQPITEPIRSTKLAKIKLVQEAYHLPVIAVDYVDPAMPNARQLARDTAARMRAVGVIPWVADANLASLGVGNIEVIPRRILVVLEAHQSETNSAQDLMETEPHRFLGIQMNYLGLSYEFIDIDKQKSPAGQLPKDILAGRYAGIVTWFLGGQDHPEFNEWIRKQVTEGMRVAMFGSLGFTPDKETAQMLGIKRVDMSSTKEVKVVAWDKNMFGFEKQAPIASRLQLMPIALSEEGLKKGRSLIELRDQSGNRFDGAALTHWGGFVWNPNEIVEIHLTGQTSWVVHPLKFLRAALQLPDDVPVPDVTSEGGRRMLMVHIDGDGFPSEAEIKSRAPKGERYYCADVMLTDFLMKYKLPTTMSIIESETSPTGSFPDRSKRLEEIARDIMKLPYIEGATHTFTHPLKWGIEVNKQIERKNPSRKKPKAKGEGNSHSLTVKGYEFDLMREVRGSVDYINKHLMPPGKTAKVILWSGDCMPPFEATEEAYRQGYLNMNGGDTLMTKRNPSWTMMSSQGLRKNDWFQIHAPDQNENVYTNDWEGPFYGFERVIETFEMTDTKHRFKPVDIYYHSYSGSKAASILGLDKAYQWAVAQPFTHLYSSEYMQKVLDFEQTTIARDWVTGDVVVRTGDHLRTLRYSGRVPFSKWAGSPGLVGVTPYRSPEGGAELDFTYLTLASGEVRLLAKPDPRRLPYVADANGKIESFSRTLKDQGSETHFTIYRSADDNATTFSLAQADGCEVHVDGRLVAAGAGMASIYHPTNVANTLKSLTLTPILPTVAYKHYEPKNNKAPDYLPKRQRVLVRCH